MRQLAFDISLDRSSTIAHGSEPLSSMASEFPFLEFFAGSGLVAEGLRPFFKAVWANDICAKKAAVYRANHGTEPFQLGSVEEVRGEELPPAVLSWASFPCQDLSLAGGIAGIHGQRSGLVWQWLRVMDEMVAKPKLLVAENVTGLVSAGGGSQYRTLHTALHQRGYRVGAIQLDAAHWVPQSRPRVFVIAVHETLPIPAYLLDHTPNWLHSPAIVKAAAGLEGWLWWSTPRPPQRQLQLADVVEWDAPHDDPATVSRNLGMIPERHRRVLELDEVRVAPGYRRTRNGAQVLELRFDGIAGCLRTPTGGSSRQLLVLKTPEGLTTRLLTVRETARLMGASETFQLPGSYNDGYMAMGDAVAAPVARYLAEHLLAPLARVDSIHE